MLDETPGGLGGDLSRSDLRLIGKAINERWPMAPGVRIKILKRLTAIIDSETEEGARSDQRNVIAAAKAIISADRLNLQQDALDLARNRVEGDPDQVSLDQLTQEAAERAERRIAERDADRPAEPLL